MKTEVSGGMDLRGKRNDRYLGTGLCILISVLFFAACGGSEESSKDPEGVAKTSEEGNPLTAPVDYLGAVNQAQKSSARKLNLMGVQQAIQQFQIMEDRLPRSLQEVVSSGYISRLPELPKGQGLHYDPQTGVVSQVQAQNSVGE